jgi:protein Tex
METTLNLDLAQVARVVNLPIDKVRATVELLDDGNTVPFITRYRKDRTGGLDEEQIRLVHESVQRLRALADRKQRILKSLQSQGKLTDELAVLIQAADSLRRLEDIYLPFKPKKQTLANLARSRGLEPLAVEILNGAPEAADLSTRAAQFVNEANGLKNVDDVLQGAGHLIAELYSENLELRDQLRKIVRTTGKLVSTRIEEAAETDADQEPAETGEAAEDELSATDAADAYHEPEEDGDDQPTEYEETVEEYVEAAEQPTGADETTLDNQPQAAHEPTAGDTMDVTAEAAVVDPPEVAAESPVCDLPAATEQTTEQATEQATEQTTEQATDQTTEQATEQATDGDEPPLTDQASDITPSAANVQPELVDGAAASDPSALAAESAEGGETKESRKRARRREKKLAAMLTIKQLAAKTRKESKKRKREQKIESFKDYFEYQEPLSKIPPHRLLAINRGDRSKILRIKIEVETEVLVAKAEEFAIPAAHPHSGFLRGRLRDALNRLILPSLEREVRRELTEHAELHAVQVFARNLRKLLLQPPVRSRRVLAIDPGFRSGCKLAALDEFGGVLGHTVIHVIGKDEVVRRGRQQMVEMLQMYHIPIIAIGNGTACRETEKLVADVIANELKHRDTQYIVVNEAGASVYSTSSVGREELPRFDPVLRSAISIGRRLQDPLSELVKINPANIGVGLYQHDVRAKHLQDSLDAVVESCVNFVGVDVNTASPALLRYVSGLNQLTARRLYEHRQKHGPFRSRDQFKEVPGFGEATFVQSAGFLKIVGGDNPLDATWIHPESYETARRVIDQLGGTLAELATKIPGKKTAVPIAQGAMAQFARGVLADSQHRERTDDPRPPTESAQESLQESPTESVPTAEPVGVGEQPPAEELQPPADATPAGEAASPETAANEQMPPEATAEALPVSETPAPEEPSPDTIAPDATAPEVRASEGTPAEGTPAEAAPSEAALSEPPAPEPPAPEPPAPEPPAPEPPAPEPPAPEPPASEPSVSGAVESGSASMTLTERAARADVRRLSDQLGIGELLLRDILNTLSRPGRDPREDLPQPQFRREIMRLEDLEPGMEMSGSVLNVVDFGAFVDIGLPDSGLVHISRLADRYIRDPHEAVSVGDILTVWVVDVDKQRRRVSLTAVKPGTEKPAEQRRERAKPSERREARAGGGPPPAGGRRESRRGEGRRDGGRPQGGKPHRSGKGSSAQHRPAPKPKPVRPITPEMVDGKEPMRSFSDLMQFFEKKSGTEGDDKPKNKKKP